MTGREDKDVGSDDDEMTDDSRNTGVFKGQAKKTTIKFGGTIVATWRIQRTHHGGSITHDMTPLCIF